MCSREKDCQAWRATSDCLQDIINSNTRSTTFATTRQGNPLVNTPINLNLTDYLTASLYAFGGIPTVRLKKRQNWEEVAKPR